MIGKHKVRIASPVNPAVWTSTLSRQDGCLTSSRAGRYLASSLHQSMGKASGVPSANHLVCTSSWIRYRSVLPNDPLAAAILGPFLCVFCCFVVRNDDDMPSLQCEAEWHKKVGVSSVFCSYSISSFSTLYSTPSAPILLSIAFISSVLTSSLLLASTHQ